MIAPVARAATYVVAPGGDDVNNDGVQKPWRTLQHAADKVMAGDTVLVRAGNYKGFDLRTGGANGQPISFIADDGVVINAPNGTTTDGINVEGVSYVVIRHFKVTGVPRNGIRGAVCDHVRFLDNVTDANGVRGIFTGHCDDLDIEGNSCSRSGKEHGIYVSNSAKRPIIRNNVCFGNAGAGIHMNGDISQGGDGIIDHALVELNVIYDNGKSGGSGINCDGVQTSIFQNNLLYGNHASGISLFRIDGGGSSTDNVVVNNTIVMASDGRWALNIQNGSTGNQAANNILYNYHSFKGSISISPDSLPGLTSDYNVVMDRFTTDDANTILKLADWQKMTGQDKHSFIATPAMLFASAMANDYHLSAMSPAIDKGTSLHAPTRDLDGDARPLGAGYDIGSDELCAMGNCMAAPDGGIAVSDGGGDGAVGDMTMRAGVDAAGNEGDLSTSSADGGGAGAQAGGCGCRLRGSEGRTGALPQVGMSVLGILLLLSRRRKR